MKTIARRNWIRTILILAFGALPVLPLAGFAGVAVIVGVFIGCVAASPVFMGLINSGAWNRLSMDTLCIAGPVLTALVILIEGWMRTSRPTGGSDKRFELWEAPQR